MKIGILTYHFPYNFGANLQAFASSQFIQSLGHDVKIIHYSPVEMIEINRKKVPKEQWNAHENFINKYIPLTARCDDTKRIEQVLLNEDFDGIIVGADAVWRYPADYLEIPLYFMQWLFESDKIKKIPVASMSVAHMGKGFLHLDKDLRRQIRNAIDNFTYITVRDKWTQHVVNKHLFNGQNKVVHLNPDPVFVMDEFIKDEWNANNLIPANSKFILLSLPNNNNRSKSWLTRFRKHANKQGFLIGELPLPDGVSGLDFDFTVPYPIDPIQWYLWLKHASGFVGLRFHAVVSCITAGTPFYSIDSYGSSALFVRVLNKAGCYRLGRAFDRNSKIYNLLYDTNFRQHRVHGKVSSVSPVKVFNLLIRTEQTQLLQQRDVFAGLYRENIQDILNALKK